jgi:hypothetical protein
LNWINLDETQIMNEIQLSSGRAQAQKIIWQKKKENKKNAGVGYNQVTNTLITWLVNNQEKKRCWPHQQANKMLIYFFFCFRFWLPLGGEKRKKNYCRIIFYNHLIRKKKVLSLSNPI